MSWWQANYPLAIITAVAIAVSSCKTGPELSGDIQPKNERLSAFFTDSLQIRTTTVYYDSVVSNNSNRVLVGHVNDANLGQITANAYCQFGLNSFFNNFGPNPFLDSVKIELTIASNTTSGYYFYGDTSQIIKFKIHRLTELLDGTKPYFINSSPPAYEATPLAQVDLDIKLDSSGRQTTFIKLDNALGQEFLNNSTSFSNTTDFLNLFKGLAFVAEKQGNCIVGIQNARIILYFRNFYAFNNLEKNETDAIPASFTANRALAFTQYSIDKSGTKFAGLTNSFDSMTVSNPNEPILIQNNTGISCRLQFPTLNSFINSVKGKILVNRAELVIKPELTDTVNYRVPESLFAFELTNTGRVKYVSEAVRQVLQREDIAGIFGTNNPYYVFYNTDTREYKFIITTYVQALIDGNKPNHGLLISAYNSQLSNGLIYNTLNRLTFYNSRTQPRNIKLNIFYTPYNN